MKHKNNTRQHNDNNTINFVKSIVKSLKYRDIILLLSKTGTVSIIFTKNFTVL